MWFLLETDIPVASRRIKPESLYVKPHDGLDSADASPPRQRPGAYSADRHGRPDRGQLRRLVLGAEEPRRRRPRLPRRLLPMRARRALPPAAGIPRPALVAGRVHRDVHACELGAHPREHALLLDLR